MLLTGERKFLMAFESVQMDCLDFLKGLLDGLTKQHKWLTCMIKVFDNILLFGFFTAINLSLCLHCIKMVPEIAF